MTAGPIGARQSGSSLRTALTRELTGKSVIAPGYGLSSALASASGAFVSSHEIEVIAIEDGRHAVVNRPKHVVRLGDGNRAALDPFTTGTVPAFPEAREGKWLIARDGDNIWWAVML